MDSVVKFIAGLFVFLFGIAVVARAATGWECKSLFDLMLVPILFLVLGCGAGICGFGVQIMCSAFDKDSHGPGSKAN